MNAEEIRQQYGVSLDVANYLANVKRNGGDSDDAFLWSREIASRMCESVEELEHATEYLENMLFN